jgi:hypothetical protein
MLDIAGVVAGEKIVAVVAIPFADQVAQLLPCDNIQADGRLVENKTLGRCADLPRLGAHAVPATASEPAYP